MRSLLTALALLIASPCLSAPLCVAIEGVIATEPTFIRLHGQELSAFTSWFNHQPPETDYDGPVWVYDLPEKDLLQFGLASPDGKAVCWYGVIGRVRSDLLQAMRGI